MDAPARGTSRGIRSGLGPAAVAVAAAAVLLTAPATRAGSPGGTGAARPGSAPGAAQKQRSRPAPSRPQSWLGVYVGGQRATISAVIPGTPAARAGLESGDRVIRVGKVAIDTSTKLIATVSALVPGTRVELEIMRAYRSEALSLEVVVEAKPGPSELLRRRFLGKPARDFNLQQVGGGTISLSDLRGEVVVIEHFGTWCGVCKSTFQTLAELADRGAVVLALSQEAPDVLQRYVAKTPPPFAVLSDRLGQVRSRYDARGLPVILAVDRQGIIRYIGMGGSRAELDMMFAAVTEALRRPANARVD